MNKTVQYLGLDVHKESYCCGHRVTRRRAAVRTEKKEFCERKLKRRAARASTQRARPFFIQPRVVCQIVIRHRIQIQFDSFILSKENMS
jgi:hypothetical protein